MLGRPICLAAGFGEEGIPARDKKPKLDSLLCRFDAGWLARRLQPVNPLVAYIRMTNGQAERLPPYRR
jgi:hypothetical protein